ncbi:MAG: thioredoxin [Gemmatimonadetes bacterium]|nr:thioredoxin [Gemmatimonadota bacterium]
MTVTISRKATIRCPFCLTLNRVDIARAVSGPRCGKCERPILVDRPVKITAEDFDRTVLEAEAPVLVDFYADWCAPCRVVAPALDEIAGEKAGEMLVAKLNTDQAAEISARYNIRGIPTLILFRGGAEVDRVVGADLRGVRALVAQA